MDNMKKQMSLFEYGGIADDGMTKDPVSGNSIPPGSLAKEVRDDIPAMLSEGEYVIPADVLRYYGVNFFENLRNKAKSGLQNMEQNGRIGGTPMTEQDVARNMQQPMMANQGVMVQGFDDGNLAQKYRSTWSPATARWNTPMFTGTSSQAANIAQAAEEAKAAETGEAAESITYMRTHYNQSGESVQIRYVGTTPENAVPAPGQEDLLAAYPLTEAEWLAYQQQMNSDDGGGEEPTPSGSSTEWMDGINWSDTASVKEWVDETLKVDPLMQEIGKKGGLLFGGIAGASIANNIAKVRGALEYYESVGDEDMVEYLKPKIDKAIAEGGLLVSALDKLGLLTGKKYGGQITDFQRINNPSYGLGEGQTPKLTQEEQFAQEEMVMSQTAAPQKDKEGKVVPVSGTGSLVTGSYTGVNTGGEDNDGPSHQEILDMHAQIRKEADDFAALSEEEKQEQYASVGGGFQDIMNKKAEGGLMTAPKAKKKRGRPKKSGLAGKK
jgi:hypothetical protein